MLVNDCHQQAQIHALDKETEHLLLQIPRFQVTGDGNVHTHSLTLDLMPPQKLRIPVFTAPDTISVRWDAFEINAMVVHKGPTPNAGHYRTVLVHPNRTGAYWYTDDGEVATYEAALNEHVMSNCYILSCARCGSVPLLNDAGEGPDAQAVHS